jgi:hypothetical protein
LLYVIAQGLGSPAQGWIDMTTSSWRHGRRTVVGIGAIAACLMLTLAGGWPQSDQAGAVDVVSRGTTPSSTRSAAAASPPADSPSATTPAATSAAKPSTAAARPTVRPTIAPPFDALPAGPAPASVPYAIGARVFFGGKGADLSARFDEAVPGVKPTAAQRQFTTVVGVGGFAVTDLVLGTDPTHVIGRLAADGGYQPLRTSGGGMSSLTATTANLVAVPDSGQLIDTTGRLVAAFTGSAWIDCGSCLTTAAGTRLVVTQGNGTSSSHTWLWYQPATLQPLPDGYRGVGRLGAGWLGQQQDDGCWRIAPASAPDRLGAPICSQTTPLVSPNGDAVVVVQAGRVEAVNRTTGATLSTATMPAIDGWRLPSDASADHPEIRYAVPATWESADSYLVTARFDIALALVRCSVKTGACQRVVRAAVRTGVDRIVTERGPSDAVPATS